MRREDQPTELVGTQLPATVPKQGLPLHFLFLLLLVHLHLTLRVRVAAHKAPSRLGELEEFSLSSFKNGLRVRERPMECFGTQTTHIRRCEDPYELPVPSY